MIVPRCAADKAASFRRWFLRRRSRTAGGVVGV